jgi:hypothetical protein
MNYFSLCYAHVNVLYDIVAHNHTLGHVCWQQSIRQEVRILICKYLCTNEIADINF